MKQLIALLRPFDPAFKVIVTVASPYSDKYLSCKSVLKRDKVPSCYLAAVGAKHLLTIQAEDGTKESALVRDLLKAVRATPKAYKDAGVNVTLVREVGYDINARVIGVTEHAGLGVLQIHAIELPEIHDASDCKLEYEAITSSDIATFLGLSETRTVEPAAECPKNDSP